MDFNEAALKERLETAVRGASPDVGALMDGGLERGERLRSRRRAQVLAAGVTATAVAALAYAGIGEGLFDSDATGPANTPNRVVQEITEPSTPRSLAAAALEHLPDEEVVGTGDSGTRAQSPRMFATVGLVTERGDAELYLFATTRVQLWDKQPPCELGGVDVEVVQCRLSTVAGGPQMALVVQRFDEGPGSSSYQVSVGVRRDDQVVAVTQAQAAEPQDESVPVAEWDLPVSVATMRDIVTDPRFGMTTTPEMIAKGEALENFAEGGSGMESGTSGSGGVKVRPKVELPPEAVATTFAPERPGAGGARSGP